jgi:signal peptidase II
MKYYKYFLLSFIIIAIDQFVKLYVHFNMLEGQAGEYKIIGNWLKIHYILNPGMAFGLKFDMYYGKLILTLFRLLATIGIGYYIYYLVKKNNTTGLAWCIALILGGALGNVIDSTFYGVFLQNNLPKDAPIAWFHGQVIDMIYVNIWEGRLPEWLGGSHISLWPIFNIADASIFVGVMFIIIYQHRFFGKKQEKSEPQNINDIETDSIQTTSQS